MLENNVICLLLDGKLKMASRWQSHSNDSFKTTESFRSESNDCFYEWFSESVIHPRQADLDSNTETKQKQHSCSCHIAELSGAFFARIS